MVTMAEIVSERAADPDAQAAVTDFLDYTEYFPSDLIRSLTLIRGLDDAYQSHSLTLNDLTKLYGTLPSLEPGLRPNAQELRTQIAARLDQALNARESAYAEARRLFDVAERHQNRLKSIIAKLNAIPKPPLRDPTPPPVPSSQVKRSRSGRKIETATRLTLHPPRGNAVASAILKKPRSRRVTVPGEVMPPYDPDSPIASTEVSDWGSPPPSPPRPVLKLKQPKPPPPSLKPQKQKLVHSDEKPRPTREETETYRKPTPPPEEAEIGSKYKPWTHLTEFEMYKLRKKMKKNHTWEPSDVMIRRELADRGRGWENYYRAKAEAEKTGAKFIDLDSVEKVFPKAETSEKAEKLDQIESVEKSDTVEVVTTPEDAIVPMRVPDNFEKPEPAAPAGLAAPVVTPAPKPKAPKKSEKKEKKQPEPILSEAALRAQEAELAARRLGDIGSKFRTLFASPLSALASFSRSASTPTANRPANSAKKATEKTSKKRKADDTPTASLSPSAEPENAKKKQKVAPKPSPLAVSPVPAAPSTSPVATSSEPPPSTIAPSAGTIKIPLKLNLTTTSANAVAPVTAVSKTPTPAPTTRAASVQRTSVAPKASASPPVTATPVSATTSRPPSRRSAAASVEPQPATTRSSRRASMTPSLAGGQKTPAGDFQPQGPSPKSVFSAIPTAASRRSKRDAPGMVMQSSQDGGAAVSVSKRKTKPAKKVSTTALQASAAAQMPQIRIDVDGRQEWVDPDEERYCVCGDVSWGEMICCELDEKCDFGQWFHMECVSLHELPPRTVKWYCPGDRKKLRRGEMTNGLVGRGIK
ncbi:PHD-finger family protein [Cladophialophora carrionii]|uniref:PHD-finger family protein n=1 Tax=Cladophialophora carrionii TaxID=86049 RepID=A0A1C1CZ40_9EURO|nr:PHD-finger family protein [Cladophialophora carrionii]